MVNDIKCFETKMQKISPEFQTNEAIDSFGIIKKMQSGPNATPPGKTELEKQQIQIMNMQNQQVQLVKNEKDFFSPEAKGMVHADHNSLKKYENNQLLTEKKDSIPKDDLIFSQNNPNQLLKFK